MLPSSPEYYWFLVILFFLYWAVWRIRALGIALVILANYFFYAKWSFAYLLIVPAASSIDFLIGRQLAISRSQWARRLMVTVSILMNVGLIASRQFALPLSLSFYGFQAMTYTIDIYRRDEKPATSFWNYLASVSFFPTTLAGPITRVATLVPQWGKANRVMSAEEGGRAIFLIAVGLSKKFLIADYLAGNLVNRVFDLPNLYSGGEVLVAAYAYAFQIYYDFSGYTDIALGSALLVGIKLPPNFNLPYRAENLADFWRRWHISLSNWLRDYLFFALPGKRSKFLPYLNVIITFTIGGLWHGANWTFLVWGLLHGIGLAVVRWKQAMTKKEIPGILSLLLTFQFVTLTWIFFRSASLESAWQMLTQIASLHFTFDNVSGSFVLVLSIGIVLHFIPKNWYQDCEKLFTALPAPVHAAFIVLLAVAIQYVGATGAAPFVYTKF